MENFQGSFDDYGTNEFDFAIAEVTDIDTTNVPLTLNLEAKELKAGDTITLRSGDPAINSRTNSNPGETKGTGTEILKTSTDRIEFTLSSNELTNLGIDEFTLVISDADPNSLGLQAGGKTIDTSLATASGFSQNDAIKYIIDNDLLSSVDLLRVSGGSIDQSGQIVSNESGVAEPTSFTPNEGRPDNPGTDPILNGGDGNDSILGGGGDDLINGGNGDDIINGGAGLDVLVGDGGADIFVVSTLGGADVIRDFNYGQDLLGLRDRITYDDLTVTQGDGAAILSYQDQAIASISGGTPNQINASLFTAI